jgi:amidohydrolase
MSVPNKTIIEETERFTDRAIAIRRRIHKNPELGFEEVETAALVSEILDELEIAHRGGIGKTGIVGLIEGGAPGPTLAIRADLDALPMEEKSGVSFASENPGKMHACGHDAHTAILLGTASLLNRFRDQLKGRVKLIFQPAEELLVGAMAMIDDGVLENPTVDMVLGFHNNPLLECGVVGYHADATYASSDAFDITFRGVSGHGAHPHLAVDTIAGAAYFVTQLQTLVSREISPVHPAVVSIGRFVGGTARNILPDTVDIEGTARTLDPKARQQVEETIRRLLDGLRVGMRVDSELDWQPGVPVLRNNPEVLASALASARDILGEDRVRELPEVSMASEDFAQFTDRVPGAHLRIGSKIEGLEAPAHRSDYDCNEEAIPAAIKVLTRAAVGLLD